MHDAEVRVFSDSVLCMGKEAMNEPGVKFSKRWVDYLEQYKESARIIDGERFSSCSTYFLAKKTNEIVREIDEWIRQGEGEHGQNFTPEACPHRVLFMGMMNEMPISSQEPKGGKALFLHAERHAAYFGKFNPGCFMYTGPGSEKTSTFEKHPDDPKGILDELATQVTEVYLVQTHPILKGCNNFQRGELKKGGANMRFDADDSSVKMMMDLISSANDFSIIFGICDYLGKIDEIDLESQRNTASVVLTPRVSETVTLSRPRGADKFSSCAQTAEGNLSARASPLENTWHTDSERSTAEGNLQLFSNQQTRKAVVARANEKTDTELLRLCKIADYAEIVKIGNSFKKHACKKQRWKWTLTSNNQTRKQNCADQGNTHFQQRRELGH